MRRREGPSLSRRAVIGIIVGVAILIASSILLARYSDRSPRRSTSSATRAGEPQSTPFRQLNVNTATIEELDTIPHVGKALARSIITHRPYTRYEDLLRVPGIKERMLERIRPYIIVDEAKPKA